MDFSELIDDKMQYFLTALGVLEVLQGSNSHLEKIHRCLEVRPETNLELTVKFMR